MKTRLATRPQSVIRRALSGVALTVAAALALSACATPIAETAADAPLTPLVVANNFAPWGGVLPLYAAEALGYYEEEGLDVDIQAMKSSQDALNAVNAGRADIAVTSAILSIANQEKGIETVSIGNSIGRHSYGFMIDEKLEPTSLKSLEGRTVLATAGFIIDEAKAVLAQEGVDVDKVSFATVSPAAILSSYTGGQGDAWLTTVPLGESAVAAARPSKTFLLADYGVTIPDYTYAVDASTLEGEPEALAAFLRAIYRAQEAALEDPEGMAEKMVALAPGIDPKVTAAQWISTSEFICSPNAEEGATQAMQVPADWALASTFLKQIGFTETEVDTSVMYTNEFADTATATCPIG